MRTLTLFLATYSFLTISMAQERQHVFHLSVLGTESASAVLSYENRIAGDLSLQGGVGITSHGGPAMLLRTAVNYLVGIDHILELSLLIDISTGSRTVAGTNGVIPNFFVGYRHQFHSGFVFRSGLNTTLLDDYYFDASAWVPKLLTVSIGYAF